MSVSPEYLQTLRLPEVVNRTGLSRSTIYRAEALGQFPKHVKIGEHASGWLAHEVDAWIAAHVATRDSKEAA